MISSDIWRKYEEWYFKIAIRNLIEIRDNFDITRVGYAKDHVQIMLLFVYTSTRKSFFKVVKYHCSKPIKLQKFHM